MITSPPRRSRLLRGYSGSLTRLIFAGSPKKRYEQEAQPSAKGDGNADERQTFHRHAFWSRAARCFGNDDQTLKNGGLLSSATSSAAGRWARLGDPVTRMMDPPPGLIPVPMTGAVLLPTEVEFTAGTRRGKWWRRQVAMERRTGETVPTASSGEMP
jgi:hypothetical protein